MPRKAIAQIAQIFDNGSLKYGLRDEDTITALETSFSGENISDMNIVFLATDDTSDIVLRVRDIAKVPASKRAAMLETLNSLNYEYRFARFFITDSSVVEAQCDFPAATENNIGMAATEAMTRIIRIIDTEAYSKIMKTIWM